MKIIVREEQKTIVNLRIPTGLIFNRLTVGLAPVICRQNGMEITRKQALAFLKVLRDYKRRHPEWKLLEVSERGGNHVEIIM